MALEKKIRKIGNSYGVIFPTEVLKLADIAIDAEVEFTVKKHQITLKPKPNYLKDHKIMNTFLKVLDDYNETFKKLA